jgi:hypothetical protein
MDADAFWTYQLTVPPRQYYGAFVYPSKLLSRLAAVVDYCSDQGIKLVFFMPPTHVELQAKREEYAIEEHYQEALAALRALAPVYDWDYPNSVTRDASLFGDPFHPNDEIAARVARELVGGSPLQPGDEFANRGGRGLPGVLQHLPSSSPSSPSSAVPPAPEGE